MKEFSRLEKELLVEMYQRYQLNRNYIAGAAVGVRIEDIIEPEMDRMIIGYEIDPQKQELFLVCPSVFGSVKMFPFYEILVNTLLLLNYLTENQLIYEAANFIVSPVNGRQRYHPESIKKLAIQEAVQQGIPTRDNENTMTLTFTPLLSSNYKDSFFNHHGKSYYLSQELIVHIENGFMTRERIEKNEEIKRQNRALAIAERNGEFALIAAVVGVIGIIANLIIAIIRLFVD